MFRKVLIANRGEIAVRIMRACHELGIETVAIHTEADAHAVHVAKADEAILVEPGPRAGYLDAEQIAEAARKAGADAVHPGYGFLSENPSLSRALTARGITLIGPHVRAIEAMGDKVEARRIAEAARVPLIPASPVLADAGEAMEWAERIGYPIMLKAAGGGGGKGMRVLRAPSDLGPAFGLTTSEAQKSFGDGRVYLEKFIQEPKHIEIQVACDRHGNRVHLGERDCSIQRRHQKLIEIAPSLVLDQARRNEMGRMALQLCEAVAYDSVGTLEFLLDQDGRYYFLETNTRIQVEHTITELVTGVDLVQEMIRIAAGEPLSFGQEDIALRGYAIECRINAEDPRRGFLPSPGTITRYLSPGGVGVRLDTCIHGGCEVLPYFDPLVAKLSVWGRTWDETLRRLGRALDEYVIRGIETTIPLYRQIVQDPDFRFGRFTTYFMEEKIEHLRYPDPVEPLDPFFTAGAVLFAHCMRGRLPPEASVDLEHPMTCALFVEADDAFIDYHRGTANGVDAPVVYPREPLASESRPVLPRELWVTRAAETFAVILEGVGPWEGTRRPVVLRIGSQRARMDVEFSVEGEPERYAVYHHGRCHQVEFVEVQQPGEHHSPVLLREDEHLVEVLYSFSNPAQDA
ncbi:MAG: acetyl-CoA carboxylase biotin carboxylase subunit [Deltaproteobacteria bacterium]|nr:acetyl-CoA carboxylase biotin carboxylase subunit [Deltaproteobacteria bacterium]